MLAFLLALAGLFAQGIPVLPNQGGTITGVLRNAAGAPAAGVRVAAQARPEALKDLATASSFAGLAETDSLGRYRLENIPPGRYYVIAGRVDAPTYYPGTVQAADGTVISVASGATVPAIDFVLNNASLGRADAGTQGVPSWILPVQVRMEGGKVPLFAGGKFPVLRVTRPSGNRIEVPLDAANIMVGPDLSLLRNQNPASTDYPVTIAELPEGYQLKSLTFGSVDLTKDPIRLASTVGGPTAGTQSIAIVLVAPNPTQKVGVRVAGRMPGTAKRSIYISGNSGALYADGTYEFVGVPPGLHRIVMLDSEPSGTALGAEIVVGDRDLNNVELEELALVPTEADRPIPPAPAGNRALGTRLPLLTIRGRVLDAETREPFNAGKAVVNGDYAHTFSLNDDGRFEIPRVLRGRYEVDVIVFGVGSASQSILLEEEDATLDLKVRGEPEK